jgi:predicted nucleotidyltransferase
MGINFERDRRVAGYKIAVIKAALINLSKKRSPEDLIDIKSIFPLRRDGAIVFEEGLDRGLIALDGKLTITEKGEAISRGRATPRACLPRACALLDEFLTGVDQLNSDPDGVRQVNEVWLFGSVMRGQETVGDIDLALVTGRRPECVADHDTMRQRLDKLLSRYAASASEKSIWAKEEWVTNRALYGPRRHPLFAGVQADVQDLSALGVPCRLIYDRARGGRVGDPILPRHPESKGRRDGFSPPSAIPDLAPCDPRPMDGRWIAGFHALGDVSPYDIFRGWTQEAKKLFPEYPKGLRVVGNGDNQDGRRWIPKRHNSNELDGRAAIALIKETPRSGVSVILKRRLEKTQTDWTLHVSFEDVELYGRQKRNNIEELSDLSAAAALIVAVDAERMLRRAAEEIGAPAVQLKVDVAGPSQDSSVYIARIVDNLLRMRTIRIEPEEWRGALVASLPPRQHRRAIIPR